MLPIFVQISSVLDRGQCFHIFAKALEMESLTFAAKLLILICLLRIPGVMADPTIIPNSDQIYDFETEDKLSIKNVTPIANSNKSSSNSSARLTS